MLNPFANLIKLEDTRTFAAPVYSVTGAIVRSNTVTVDGNYGMVVDGIAVLGAARLYWLKRISRGAVMVAESIIRISKKVARQLHIELGRNKVFNHYQFVEFIVERPISSLCEITPLELQDVLECIREQAVAA